MTSENDQSASKLCPICHEEIDYFAYGACNHPTCTKCVLKLRKFGSADEPDFSKCPTCRRNLNKIVIMESFVPFDQVNTSSMRHDAQYDFVYPTQNIECYYRDMLRSRCPICGEEKSSLSALNRHTTLEHQLSYCDLCIRYARLLPCEFVPMKPADLVLHRKWDNQRKRGHPSCKFCEERFYEFEDLIHHLRDLHFLCDLCRNTGKFVVFREQHELLTHYCESHHLCNECRQQQRISCFSTAENLGLHRVQEHPDEVNNDPNSWMPISIELARNTDFPGQRRRDPMRQGVDRVGGVLSSTDGRLIAEGTQVGVQFRRPNPSEWTGDDFPALAAGSQSQEDRSGSAAANRPQTAGDGLSSLRQNANNVRSPTGARPAGQSAAVTLAALTSGGRNARLTADDFPSLSSSGSANAAPAPTWIKSSSGGRSSASSETNRPNQPRVRQTQTRPTASDFPELPHESGRSGPAGVATNWVVPEASRRSPDGFRQTATPQQQTRQTAAVASDFPGLSGRRADADPAPQPLPPFTQRSGLQPPKPVKSKSKPAANRRERQQMAATDPAPLPYEAPVSRVMVRSRQHRNADIRFGLSGTFTQEDADDDSEAQRQRFCHIQTVDVLPNTTQPASTPVDPVDLGPEDFPSLEGKTAGAGASKSSRKGKKQAGRQKGAEQQPSPLTPITNRIESLVPKTPVEQHKKPPTKKAPPATVPGISKHDWVDTECVLYASTPYTPVPEEESRNRELIRTVELELSDVSGKSGFTRFADLSRRYRHKQLTAKAYLEALSSLLIPCNGPDAGSGDAVKSPVWIAPMLALLPDVGLQRALLRVLQGQGAPKLPPELLPPDLAGTRVREPILTPPTWAKAVLGLLQCCRECGQVCLRTDLQVHLQQAHSPASA